ncbi:hypothetical protein [Chryseobacterium arthrosphaerae]|uniref:hypothetical protein n=1 Tax=Chryseobacterium arthrosphaerae TaxID=651561 RepID=UPI00241E893C|nr:hypothetical protein [Chryseobacterium arthrosphaerae]
MSYPEHNIVPADQDSWFGKALEQKLIEFTPYTLCSFYKGFTVLQMYGEESKEYFFGNYFNGKYCGYIYVGNVFSQLEAASVCEQLMPKDLSELKKCIIENCEKVSYSHFPMSQYAWIYDRVISKI